MFKLGTSVFRTNPVSKELVMEYQAVVHKQFFTVREALGVNDLEWELGVCILNTNSTREYSIKREAEAEGFIYLDRDMWSTYIETLNDPKIVTSNRFVPTRVPLDKWDTDRYIW